MKYDVVVVGAGPAGSTAAKHLAEQNHTVLLLDKSVFPRNKPCGGGLPVHALERFPFLKQADFIDSYSYGGYAYYSRFENQSSLERKDPLLAMVLRKHFDYKLVQLAIQHGAVFQDGTTVRSIKILKDSVKIVLDDKSSVTADIVIGADGVWSTVARSTGLCGPHRPVSLCIFQEYPLSEKKMNEFFGSQRWCHIFLKYHDIIGYGWVFPKKECVNIGIDEVRIRKHLVKEQRNLKRLYEEFFSLLQEKKVIPPDLKTETVQGAALPIVPLKKTYADRVLLCGDAAGFINPITGEGLYYALVSGNLAAEVCHQALIAGNTSKRFLSRYQSLWKQDFGTDLRLFLRVYMRWERFANFAYKIVVSDPVLSEMILDVGIGKTMLRQARRKVFMRLVYAFVRYVFQKKTIKNTEHLAT